MTTTKGIFLLGLLACSGCATMFQGSSQKIPVASTPAGAAVTVNGQPMGETPLVLDLKRKEHAALTIRAEGYDPYTTILQRKRGGWFWGDMLIGLTIYGLVSPIVDMATGAVYVLEPQSLNIKLQSPREEQHEKKRRKEEAASIDSLFVPERGETRRTKPVSVPAPIKKPPRPKGIGVSRHAIQSIFEKPELGFTFEFSHLEDGRPRVNGSSELALIELIGPPEDISSAYIMVFLPNDSPQDVTINLLRLGGFMSHAVPTWKEGVSWLTDNLERVIAQEEVQTTHGHLIITLKHSSSLGSLSLKIAVQEE